MAKLGSNADINPLALAHYYARHARDLPWRDAATTPWGVLVSEVMLQQTPVARVQPAYQRWMARWPTAESLAAAERSEVIRAWDRLGYPRRALRLQDCARAIVERYGGAVPTSVDQLLELPGIGDYTARAIAAFAFGQRVPVVDTNVRRVLMRAVRGRNESGPATRQDRDDVLELLPSEAALAVTVSAALMELGAMICTAAAPACDNCPIRETCAWRAAGYPESDTPTRRGQAWEGTDRQMRGQIMAVLRREKHPVSRQQLATDTPSYPGRKEQWERCLASLIRDGLAAENDGLIALP